MTILSDRIKEVLDRRCAEKVRAGRTWEEIVEVWPRPCYMRSGSSVETCWQCHQNDEEAEEIARAVEEVQLV